MEDPTYYVDHSTKCAAEKNLGLHHVKVFVKIYLLCKALKLIFCSTYMQFFSFFSLLKNSLYILASGVQHRDLTNTLSNAHHSKCRNMQFSLICFMWCITNA